MARPRKGGKRPDRLDALLHPTTRFLWGLVLIAVLVLSPRWEIRAVVMLLGGALAVSAGKRISFGYFVALAGTVVLFHALAPFGKVLFVVGNFPVTEGALLGGWKNGLTMAGLVFVSLGTISRRLHLPGRLGELWALTFAWYEKLLESKHHVNPRALLLSIDRILEQNYSTRENPEASNTEVAVDVHPPTRTWGWVLAASTSLTVVLLAVVVK